MKKILFAKVLICALSFGGVLYAYLEQQNDLTYLRIELPQLEDVVRILEEENMQLSLEIDRFENPKHLMELAHRPEYSHLKHPTVDEVMVLQIKGLPVQGDHVEKDHNNKSMLALPSVVIGAR